VLPDTEERRRALVDRIRRAATPDEAWQTRAFRVAGLLGPALTTHDGKIEFPGDPMCLYGALAAPMSEVRELARGQARVRDTLVGPYLDMCPDWARFPSPAERLAGGPRRLGGPPPTTDDMIFDPRVWNDEVRDAWIAWLRWLRPAVLLVSSVSAAMRHATEMAACAKQVIDGVYIVLGGRHCDEAMTIDVEDPDGVRHRRSSPIRAMAGGEIPAVFDLCVASPGGLILPGLLKVLAQAADLDGRLDATRARAVLRAQRAYLEGQPGPAAIALAGEPRAIVARGQRVDLASVPAPYEPFVIRARFPIFFDGDGVKRTAHMLTSTACPFACSFCSEGLAVRGGMTRVDKDLATVVGWVQDARAAGARAIFFDDSVFLNGRRSMILEFCGRVRALDVEWGAQLTVRTIEAFARSDATPLETIRAMAGAGCTYIYVGIESAVDDVMLGIAKARGGDWLARLRAVLEQLRAAGLRVGASVLFGLHGETADTIRRTIEVVEDLIASGLLFIASPNVCSYRPGTALTQLHGVEDELDFFIAEPSRPPYVYFEEAFPGLVSRTLSEADIWMIHTECSRRWGSIRNANPMQPFEGPLAEASG
jgi:hypothetical protein